MNFLKLIFKDILYVSKITGTQRKKFLITTSVIFSQLAVFIDVFLITLFALIIANQKTGISYIDSLSSFIERNRYLIIFIVFSRFVFIFAQSYILKNIEYTVTKNLKEFILSKIFERGTYSISDSFFYINQLSAHIGYFYSNVSSFLNNTLSVLMFMTYLIFSSYEVLAFFIGGLIFLFFPIRKIIKTTREYVDRTYISGKDSNKEVGRVIENIFLIKILGKSEDEINKFSIILNGLNSNLLNKHIFSILNGYLPSFLTLMILSAIIIFVKSIKLTLDFIGVVLKLFQAISQLTTSFSNIVNSHVHIKRFLDLKFHEENPYKINFQINSAGLLEIKNASFRYQNSEINIFDNISLEIKKGEHTIITGENGSGKSTLLGLLAGIYYPQKGIVSSYSNKYGYVSANPYIFNDTLFNNIVYGNEDLKVNEKYLLEILKEFNTFKKDEEYDLHSLISNKSLSSGQMQKIGFIRILISKPDIVLLDESTSNLDTDSKKVVFEKLKDLNSTIINSTHDPQSFELVDHHLNIEIINEKRIIKQVS